MQDRLAQRKKNRTSTTVKNVDRGQFNFNFDTNASADEQDISAILKPTLDTSKGSNDSFDLKLLGNRQPTMDLEKIEEEVESESRTSMQKSGKRPVDASNSGSLLFEKELVLE